ncbi:hypothetical protein [Microbulbifer taiwanensis]|uniref:hypothetical protein n=1 Tax=Microbulbifer taiwanensis TaxID=986746 RepID=UPI003607DA33
MAEPDGDRLRFPPVLPEQRFNQPDSGLIGAVTDQRGRVIWRSESSLAVPQLPSHPLPQGRQAFGQVRLPGDAGRYTSFRQGWPGAWTTKTSSPLWCWKMRHRCAPSWSSIARPCGAGWVSAPCYS